MSTNTGELREILVECIDKVKAGKMSDKDAKAIAMLAGQITLSLQVEVNARREEVMLSNRPVGQLGLGDDATPLSADEQIERHPKEVETIVPKSVWPGAVTIHRLEG